MIYPKLAVVGCGLIGSSVIRAARAAGAVGAVAVADASVSLILSGTGDVVEPEDGLIGIGSGGNFALAAARALSPMDLDAEEIARRSMKIAADLCVYTNHEFTIETL